MASPRKPLRKMVLRMPSFQSDVDYSMDLGAESTPGTEEDRGTTEAIPEPDLRRRVLASSETLRRAAANDMAQLAARARAAGEQDCGICEEPASDGLRTQCCGALFCRVHINDWIYGPSASDLCPACNSTCLLPPPPSSDSGFKRPRTPPSTPSVSRKSSMVALSRTSTSASLLSLSTTAESELEVEPRKETAIKTKTIDKSGGTIFDHSWVRVVVLLGALVIVVFNSSRGAATFGVPAATA
ncbi:hypothetical protein FB45DRAFT_932982 [Roridomyces roridus]|uniref:RING-type domain-containing protein n=1 Tax=Roridomyces roridus TaxID=1738132 RepID=A0AAD7FG21_9AGAR|nr:hypothetical protein FB45DRAFT_932982 [Roridomyces roridus]